MTLHEKILSLRKKSGMSQEELALKLGVSRQSVSRWEAGTASPDAQNLRALSLLFSVSADFLLNDEAEAAPEDSSAIAPVHATPRQISCTVYEASPRKVALYNFLTTLPVFFMIVCIDYTPTVMIMCWVCALLACFARIFNAKSASFSQAPQHLRKRHFLLYIVILSSLCAFTVLLFFTFFPNISEMPLNAALCLFLLQLYEIVSLEISLYTPGDNSNIIREFRMKFYRIVQWLCAPAATILTAFCICIVFGFKDFEIGVVCAVLTVFAIACSVSTVILTRKVKKI